jgi:hypothetical protein
MRWTANLPLPLHFSFPQLVDGAPIPNYEKKGRGE